MIDNLRRQWRALRLRGWQSGQALALATHDWCGRRAAALTAIILSGRR